MRYITIRGKDMPKMKSVKGAVKRFRVKKVAKLNGELPLESHILTKVDGKHHRHSEAQNM